MLQNRTYFIELILIYYFVRMCIKQLHPMNYSIQMKCIRILMTCNLKLKDVILIRLNYFIKYYGKAYPKLYLD